MSAIEDVIEDVKIEIDRQNGRWGEQNHSLLYWMSILMEEVGESCQSINQTIGGGNKGGFVNTRQELVQIAAVAINMIASMDRQDDPFRGD